MRKLRPITNSRSKSRSKRNKPAAFLDPTMSELLLRTARSEGGAGILCHHGFLKEFRNLVVLDLQRKLDWHRTGCVAHPQACKRACDTKKALNSFEITSLWCVCV